MFFFFYHLMKATGNSRFSQLLRCGHPAISDTPLLRTDGKSPAETTMKCIEITLAITDSRNYGIADTSCGLKLTFVLFYSRYNGHLLFISGSTLNILFVITSVDKNDRHKSVFQYDQGLCTDLQSSSALLTLL